MKIIHNIKEMKKQSLEWKKSNLTIGLVPTMGSLHEGHISLMQNAHKSCDRIVVSDFVNPIQFGPNEDYENYPRNLDYDSKICTLNDIDVLFNPDIDEMYPKNFCSYVEVENLEDSLCGLKRPGHFRGVCTVVNKLFNIIQPDLAFFGQKDAQQLAIIKRMVKDLNMNVTIVGCPIIRETDGLAKSSRNIYLSQNERQASLCLSQSLAAAKALIDQGEQNSENIKKAIKDIINNEDLAKIDYIEIVSLETLKPIKKLNEDALIAIAVYIGTTRLIDNFMFQLER